VFGKEGPLSQQTFDMIVAAAAIVVALSFAIQAAVFIRMFGYVKRLTQMVAAFQAKVDPVVSKVEPVIAQVETTVTKLKDAVDSIGGQARDTFEKITVETRAVAAAISTTSREIAALAFKEAEHLSKTVEHSTEVLDRQVTELDRLLTRTQGRIEYTTSEVQATILTPVRELSALVAGIRRALEIIFRQERKEIDRAYQDEELFI